MKSLAIRDAHLWYGSYHALRGVSIDIAMGEFVALVGPSGCGKTSLLRSVAGFVTPQKGTISIGDKDVAALPPRRRNLGIVFQSYALFPHMTALENVCFGLLSRRVPVEDAKRNALDCLAMVGLAGFEERKPNQLSGGQQQRVALARALVIEPDVLLLDEPLGALDRKLRLQMQGELKALQARLGITAILVTHDQEEAMVLANRIAIMRAGLIEQIGSPDAVFARPRNAWVADFMGAGSVLHGIVRRDATGARIQIADGASFALPTPTAAHDGQNASYFVRADHIILKTAPDASYRIAALRFMGVHTEVEIERGTFRLRALLPADQAAGLSLGQPVEPAIAPDNFHPIETMKQGEETT